MAINTRDDFRALVAGMAGLALGAMCRLALVSVLCTACPPVEPDQPPAGSTGLEVGGGCRPAFLGACDGVDQVDDARLLDAGAEPETTGTR